MPFSDPMADGPAIQASSQRALKAGQTMKRPWQWSRPSAPGRTTPIVLMGYYNPIYVYPVDRFVNLARDPAGLPEAGADIIELGMPFTDPMADGLAIRPPRSGAQSRPDHEEDAGDG